MCSADQRVCAGHDSGCGHDELHLARPLFGKAITRMSTLLTGTCIEKTRQLTETAQELPSVFRWAL